MKLSRLIELLGSAYLRYGDIDFANWERIDRLHNLHIQETQKHGYVYMAPHFEGVAYKIHNEYHEKTLEVLK